MATAEAFEHVEVSTKRELWDWLESHHSQNESVWLVTWKAAHRDRYVSRDEVLDALIAYGWIDGRRMKLDQHKTKQLIAPRQQKAWARSYIRRAERLLDAGMMRAPGLEAINVAKASGLYLSAAHVDDLVEPEALLKALQKAGALGWWQGAAPSYRRNILRWIDKAKRDTTKTKRIGITVEHAVHGKKVPNY